MQFIIGEKLIYIAAFLEIIGFVSLNTSIGIIAANRGVKVNGMYKLIRHPIYMSYMILYIGYFLSNATSYNFFILTFIIAFQLLRINAEEKILIDDPKYAHYVKKVKWRLIPGIY